MTSGSWRTCDGGPSLILCDSAPQPRGDVSVAHALEAADRGDLETAILITDELLMEHL